ncbi:MAG: hypothetical protein OEW00_00840 [candidate division Zixibacteria bacterium]|nr:hypothetical protein [candidate division Zixibacteria bacterium]
MNKVVLWGVMSILVVVVVIIWGLDYFTAVKEEIVQTQVLSPQSVTLRELRAREAEEFGSYKLLDSAGSVYRIPIDRAMEIVADEAYRQRLKATSK